MDTNPPKSLFFAKQVITNACATQAILSILMNIESSNLSNSSNSIQLGSTLKNLKEFTNDFDPELKGMTLGESEVIRSAHNSIAKPEAFEMISSNSNEKSDAYHFIAYIPFEDRLYELDGLQPGPILLEESGITIDNWLEKVVPHIQERVGTYESNEVNFNLMAVCRDREKLLNEQLQTLTERLSQQNITEEERIYYDLEIQALKTDIDLEREKKKRWTQENIRRRHNYIPFLLELLKTLAKSHKLESMIQSAKEKKVQSNQQ